MPAREAPRLVSRRDLVKLRASWKRRDLRVVFTNGVFDILHRGHLDLLTRAKSYGEILVVGLNSDDSVRRLKGPTRPINRQRDRAALLLALKMVDCVCIFQEDTPYELIKTLMPDVLVKGSEYRQRNIVGADLVASWRGRIKRVPMRRGFSSSRILRRLAH